MDMRRVVFEFTHAENDEATVEYALLVSAYETKQGLRDFVVLIAAIPLLLALRFIFPIFDKATFQTICILYPILLLLWGGHFLWSWYRGPNPKGILNSVHNKPLTPSEELENLKIRIEIVNHSCHVFECGVNTGTMELSNVVKIIESDNVLAIHKKTAALEKVVWIFPKNNIVIGTIDEFKDILRSQSKHHTKVRYCEIPKRWQQRLNAEKKRRSRQ